MISTKRSLQSLALVLVVFTVFTVSLTENLQIADGLSSVGKKMVFDLDVGDTQVQQFGVRNSDDFPIDIQIYATGEGSELFVFDEVATLEAGELRRFDIFVQVPNDHPDNIEYHPAMFAIYTAPPLEDGVTGLLVSMQVQTNPIIRIGDNPVYTPPEVVIVEVQPESKVPKSAPPVQVEKEPEESLEDRLERIKAGNLEDATEVQVDDVFEEEAVPELQVDDSYIEEPVGAISQPAIEEKVECGFIDWFLSLFGFGKC